MWPFDSSYLTVVTQKCDQRALALQSAPQVTQEHRQIIQATGNQPDAHTLPGWQGRLFVCL